MNGYWFATVLVAIVLLTILQLLRTRRLREKYAATWMVAGVVIAILALVPGMLASFASLVGVATPVNLLFALGGAALLVVCIQYSVEISVLESETRTLAEESAMLRHEVGLLAARLGDGLGAAHETPVRPQADPGTDHDDRTEDQD